MDGATQLSVTGLVNILLSLICIVFVWWILQGVRLEAVMRQGRTAQARALMILLSIVLGHLLARFLIDYLDWSRWMGQLFS
jgi:uncharacterized integral membrane protein (TIGR02327 family)